MLMLELQPRAEGHFQDSVAQETHVLLEISRNRVTEVNDVTPPSVLNYVSGTLRCLYCHDPSCSLRVPYLLTHLHTNYYISGVSRDKQSPPQVRNHLLEKQQLIMNGKGQGMPKKNEDSGRVLSKKQCDTLNRFIENCHDGGRQAFQRTVGGRMQQR